MCVLYVSYHICHIIHVNTNVCVHNWTPEPTLHYEKKPRILSSRNPQSFGHPRSIQRRRERWVPTVGHVFETLGFPWALTPIGQFTSFHPGPFQAGVLENFDEKWAHLLLAEQCPAQRPAKRIRRPPHRFEEGTFVARRRVCCLFFWVSYFILLLITHTQTNPWESPSLCSFSSLS